MGNWLLLTWIGACVVELPYSELGKIFSFVYFFVILGLVVLYEFQDSCIK